MDDMNCNDNAFPDGPILFFVVPSDKFKTFTNIGDELAWVPDNFMRFVMEFPFESKADSKIYLEQLPEISSGDETEDKREKK